MRVDGLGSANFDFVAAMLVRKLGATGDEVAADVGQLAALERAQEIMLRVLEYALYQQSQMSLKLVRIVGELYEGRNIDALV